LLAAWLCVLRLEIHSNSVPVSRSQPNRDIHSAIGRNPTGAVEQIVVEFGALRRAKPVVVAGCAAVAVAYLLARNDSISNWWFVVIVGAVIVAMPLAAKRLAPPMAAAAPADGQGGVPLELVGVARPFEPADRDMLDRELGLPVGGR